MTLIPLDIPAGVYRNGTDLQSQGRWRDANLVRWIDGTMRPLGGWRERSSTAAAAKIRGMLAWGDNDKDRWLVGGTYEKLYVWSINGTRSDITPAGFTSGREDALAFTGYGGNVYGGYAYGVARPETSLLLAATSWSLDTWGENLVGCTVDDGKIYEWALATGTPAAVVANAPVNNSSIVVTAERFLFALGAGGNPRLVQWSDREDNTTWTPAATNEAGDLELETSGEIMKGVRVRGQTLILTSTDAHAANYIGPSYVYGIERVGSSCGLIAKEAVAVVDAGAFWMGAHAFYAYTGGGVQEIQSDVSDYVFNDANRAQISKAFAVANSNFGEIFWFYPSGSSTENDRYVAYNYIEKTWYTGDLPRTAGVDRGALRQPIWASADNYKIYEHEIGFDYSGLTPFAESGPIMLGSGDKVASVVEMIPDEKTQGDVSATFKTRFYPNGTERDYGPFDMSMPTSMRFTGRQIRLRIDGVALGDWRVGINRIDVLPGGRR
tara:strand:+ start:1065 stop:2546 length:1482 start_codon:yes stop_codon:yes gene_type:complete